MDLLIGTSNPGKLREISAYLSGLNLRFLSLRDAGLESLDIEEPFETFEANAEHKARAYAQASGLAALADDTGLVVDALGGRPGVYSARYASGADQNRYLKLLGELEGVPDERRTARFVCAMAVVDPRTHAVETRRGTVEGRIAQAPSSGTEGFGYDAVFIPNGYNVTLAEIPLAEKNGISHRGDALRQLIPVLDRWSRG